jgi:hypothetical protein
MGGLLLMADEERTKALPASGSRQVKVRNL